MSSYLFCAWDGGGAVFPTLSVARAMTERGHDVRVLGDPVLRRRDRGHRGAGDLLDAHAASHRAHARERPVQGLGGAHADRRLLAHARPADVRSARPTSRRDVLDELERRPADVIVTEVMLAGALVAGEAAGVPVALITTTVDVMPAPGRPPFGRRADARDRRRSGACAIACSTASRARAGTAVSER